MRVCNRDSDEFGFEANPIVINDSEPLGSPSSPIIIHCDESSFGIDRLSGQRSYDSDTEIMRTPEF